MTSSRGYSVSSSEWLFSDTDKEITFSYFLDTCHKIVVILDTATMGMSFATLQVQSNVYIPVI